eukprot:6468337-Amphidinium_carterae.2
MHHRTIGVLRLYFRFVPVHVEVTFIPLAVAPMVSWASSCQLTRDELQMRPIFPPCQPCTRMSLRAAVLAGMAHED